MDDEEDELALMRLERKAKLGEDVGATRGERSRSARECGFSEMPSTSKATHTGGSVGSGLLDDGDDEMSDIRPMFPMSFGKQQPKHVPRGAVHETTRRAIQGPPRFSGKESPPAASTGNAKIQGHTGMKADATGTAQVGNNAGRQRSEGNISEPLQPSQRPGFMGPPKPVHLMGPPKPPGLLKPQGVQRINGDSSEPPLPSQSSGLVGPPKPSHLIGPPKPPGLLRPQEFAEKGPSQDAVDLPSEQLRSPRSENNHRATRNAVDAQNAHSSDAAAGDAVDGDLEELARLPITNEVKLQGHYKLVSAIDIDRAGARVLTGGMDYNVHLYDFNGMKADGKPFRELMPQDGHPVNAVSFSPSGDAFICITGEPRAKCRKYDTSPSIRGHDANCSKGKRKFMGQVYDRDGREQGEFKRGDMYLRDLKNTKGHVAGCTHGQWHPTDRHTAMTSSTDGTVRVWDCEKIEQKMVVKPTATGSGRIPVTACCYNAEGTLIAAALTNGAIQLWAVTGDFGRSAALGIVPVPKPQQALFGKQTWKYASGAKYVLKNAHPQGTEVVDLKFLRNGHSLLSRGADETCKLWDVRALKEAVHEWTLPLPHSHSRLCISPQEDMLLAGVLPPSEKGSASRVGGVMVAMSLKPPYELVQRVGMPGPVTSICWHPGINQILVGTGEQAKGWTTVLYNPDTSEKGALLCAGKKPRQPNPFDYQPPLVIHTPGALPMFRDDSWRKRKHMPDSGEIRKVQNPDVGPGVSGPGGGGKIGHTNHTLLTQYLLEKGGMQKLEEQIDPREAFLRHKSAENDMKAWTKAYAKTQPQKQFADPDEENDGQM